jgi:hypothetical protein
MRETVSYYNVRDFDAIRIICKHAGCGAVIELPPKRIEEALKKTNACCPLCGKPFTKPDVEGGADVVTQLAKVVIALSSLDQNVGIQFPVMTDE